MRHLQFLKGQSILLPRMGPLERVLLQVWQDTFAFTVFPYLDILPFYSLFVRYDDNAGFLQATHSFW